MAGNVTRTETALVVPVPAADPLIGAFRRRLDPGAALGVPAHVTVLYPFLRPDAITSGVVDALTALVGSQPAFDLTLGAVRWFDDTVVYLDPEPDAPFRRLTELIWQRWPECPPYEGVHADVIPHVTIGDGAPLDELRTAADAIEPALPIVARVDRVELYSGTSDPGSWRCWTTFPLQRQQGLGR